MKAKQPFVGTLVSGDLSGTQHFTNTITYDRRRDELQMAIRYENVNALGAVLITTTAGTFISRRRGERIIHPLEDAIESLPICDYGLNTDKPTSPWRERTIPM